MYITHIDTACVLIEINGYRILTDPTLDHSGKLYHHGFGAISRKTSEPVLPAGGLGEIDLVLLSHHQHKDNFDNAGKEFTKKVATVISTKRASEEIKGIIGLNAWESYAVQTTKVPGLKITATPAQHRPSWVPEFLSGKVTGFIVEYDAQTSGVLYISGDTVYFKGIEEVAKRYRIDIGIFNVGGVQFRYLTALGKYTMDGKGLIRSVKQLNPGTVIPVHTTGWTHFKEKESHLKKVLQQDETIAGKTIFLNTGERTLI